VYFLLHADHLYKEAVNNERRGNYGNHALQVGTVLIYAGCLFPEFENAKEYVRMGKIIVQQILERAIFPDGGSVEDSPTYSHFIARLYFDAYMLLENNGYETIEGLKESIQKQYAHLYQFCRVNGKTVPFNDSYITDAHHDIDIIESISDIKVLRQKKSVAFMESNLAVLRRGDYEVFVDAMEHTQWHQHAGRPNFAVYYKGDPVVIDSGGVNYDRYPLRNMLKSTSGHNAVYTKEGAFSYYEDVEENLKITEFVADEMVTVEGTVTVSDVQYYIKRTIQMLEDGVKVTDYATSEKEYTYCIDMHLSEKRYTDSRTVVKQLLGEQILYVTCPEDHTVEMRPCTNDENRLDISVVVATSKKTKTFTNEFTFQIK